MALRVVLIATAPPAALAMEAWLRRVGHDLPAVVSLRVPKGRFGGYDPARLLGAAPGSDLIFIASPGQLAAYAPDVGVCCTFPTRIPDSALAVPWYGIVNVHPGSCRAIRAPIRWAGRCATGIARLA